MNNALLAEQRPNLFDDPRGIRMLKLDDFDLRPQFDGDINPFLQVLDDLCVLGLGRFDQQPIAPRILLNINDIRR